MDNFFFWFLDLWFLNEIDFLMRVISGFKLFHLSELALMMQFKLGRLWIKSRNYF